MVWKPFDKSGNRCDVANPQTATPYDAIAQIEKPNVVNRNSQRTNEKPTRPTNRGDQPAYPGSDPFHPPPHNGRRKSQKNNAKSKCPKNLRPCPVLGRGFGYAKDPRHGNAKNAKRIGLTNTQMNRQSRGGNQPAVEPGGCLNRFGGKRKQGHQVTPNWREILLQPRSYTPNFPDS